MHFTYLFIYFIQFKTLNNYHYHFLRNIINYFLSYYFMHSYDLIFSFFKVINILR